MNRGSYRNRVKNAAHRLHARRHRHSGFARVAAMADKDAMERIMEFANEAAPDEVYFGKSGMVYFRWLTPHQRRKLYPG